MNWLKKLLQDDGAVWVKILVIFFLTRLLLSFIGYISITFVPQQSYQDWKNDTLEIQHPLLHQWAVWDSGWYLKIAQNGYSDSIAFDANKYSPIGFFPLYPALVSFVYIFIHDYLIAGLLLSNLLLICSAYIFYELIRLDYDQAVADRALFYLFLFPSAYVLSSFYPESLLLCMWLASIFFARKGNWPLAGAFGFLSAFVKPQGFFVFAALIWIYLFQTKKFNEIWAVPVTKIKAFFNIKLNVLWTTLPLLGIFLWGLCNKLITGDLMAYSHIQQGAWSHHFTIPFITIYNSLFYQPDFAINSWITIIAIIILIAGLKKIPFSYWILALLVVLFNSSTGWTVGTLRYLASVFPLIIILASWGKNETTDRIIIITMSFLQGCFFVLWVAGYFFLS